jgi:hypothetical protein
MRLLTHVLDDIKFELSVATAGHPPFNSPHEGIAVIDEEFDELKHEVYKRAAERDKEKMYGEACQVAAMAIRFMTDCCGEPSTRPAEPPQSP